MPECRCVNYIVQYRCGCSYIDSWNSVKCGLRMDSRCSNPLFCLGVAPNITHLSNFCHLPSHQQLRFNYRMWQCCQCHRDGLKKQRCIICHHPCCHRCTQGTTSLPTTPLPTFVGSAPRQIDAQGAPSARTPALATATSLQGLTAPQSTAPNKAQNRPPDMSPSLLSHQRQTPTENPAAQVPDLRPGIRWGSKKRRS